MKIKEIRERLDQQRKGLPLGKRPFISVYHLTKDGDNIPARATAISGGKVGKKLIWIEGDFLDGSHSKWVAAETLTLQSDYT